MMIWVEFWWINFYFHLTGLYRDGLHTNNTIIKVACILHSHTFSTKFYTNFIWEFLYACFFWKIWWKMREKKIEERKKVAKLFYIKRLNTLKMFLFLINFNYSWFSFKFFMVNQTRKKLCFVWEIFSKIVFKNSFNNQFKIFCKLVACLRIWNALNTLFTVLKITFIYSTLYIIIFYIYIIIFKFSNLFSFSSKGKDKWFFMIFSCLDLMDKNKEKKLKNY